MPTNNSNNVKIKVIIYEYKKIFSLELSLLLIIPLIYIVSWQSFVLSTTLSLFVVIITFILFHKTQDIVFFTLGTVLGSIGEICVVYFGVWEYTKPLFLGIPLWLSLFWGYVFLLIKRLGLKILDKNNIIPYILKNKKINYIFLLISYPALILIPSLLFKYNIAVFFGLFILNIILLYRADNEDMFFAISFAILGILLEILSVYAGIWKYANPDIFGIPIWLILLYSGFSLFIKKTANLFLLVRH